LFFIFSWTQALIAFVEKGLYRQAETILHRLDPRVKVLSCLTFVVLSFAAVGWLQLLFIFATVSAAVWAASPLSQALLRLFWLLRWLLLFTLLMHLFFSPGRTLLGLSWLSLDGLLSGTFVCIQILLAVSISVLLGLTTSSESLSLTFGWFVQPLRWLGCRTEEWQKVVLLAIDFVPVVHEEIRLSNMAGNMRADNTAHHTNKSRLAVWGKKLHGLIFRLVDRGEEIAKRLAANDDVVLEKNILPSLLPLALLDKLFSMVVCLAILSYFLVG
jgi:energy-coupling factor transport system permease protein